MIADTQKKLQAGVKKEIIKSELTVIDRELGLQDKQHKKEDKYRRRQSKRISAAD